MLCKYCGGVIDDKAVTCVYCGEPVDTLNQTNNQSNYRTYPYRNDNSQALGIVGIIFALLLPIVTYIVSGIGLSKAIQNNNSGSKVLNIIALIIAGINSLIGIMIMNR